MYKIEPGLWQGGMRVRLPPGVNAVVCLQEIAENPPDLNFSDDVRAHVYLPIPDGPDPGAVWLRAAAGVVASLRRAGYGLYIHCAAGISRSAFLTAAHLMESHGWTPDHALNVIAMSNPTINPAPAFLRRLEEWQTELRNR